ncbi:hypothetical protein ES703_45011 [subsurface metagenome]
MRFFNAHSGKSYQKPALRTGYDFLRGEKNEKTATKIEQLYQDAAN